MRELNDWFLENKRDFPWREDPSPYKVWISEVMLQQTRASVVIPYFLKWLQLFPDVESLAKAPIEAVIKAWEGLGYYSRARNLHKGALQIIEEFGGQIPSKKEELKKIHGLGPYTVGAIMSFGFKKRAAAVDGNVTRVLARFFCLKENVQKQSTKQKIASGAEALLDSEEPWVTAEAFIELGATICTPKPRCEICPLQKNCLGKENAHFLPIKNEERKITTIKRAVIWLEVDGKILIKKGERGKIMADLYELPYFEMGDEIWSIRQIEEACIEFYGASIQLVKKLPRTLHSFTRYKAELYPVRFKGAVLKNIADCIWIEIEKLESLPFSSGHRRILSL